MRTVIAYLTSLLCHATVLIPLAHISNWPSTPPRYAMQRGGAASPSLRASLAAPGDAAELDETRATVCVATPAAQPVCEAVLIPPAVVVLPEAKVLASVDFQAVARRPASSTPERIPTAIAKPAPKPSPPAPLPLAGEGSSGSAAAISRKPGQGATAGPTGDSRNAPGRAAGSQRTGRVASRGRGSHGADAATAAGSSGNRGGGRADQFPTPLAANPVPAYPADALARGIEGLVLLRVRIAADGSVAEAAIHESSGTPSLDESALSTVRRHWRFQPATRGGAAVSYEAILPIRFTIRTG